MIMLHKIHHTRGQKNVTASKTKWLWQVKLDVSLFWTSYFWYDNEACLLADFVPCDLLLQKAYLLVISDRCDNDPVEVNFYFPWSELRWLSAMKHITANLSRVGMLPKPGAILKLFSLHNYFTKQWLKEAPYSFISARALLM